MVLGEILPQCEAPVAMGGKLRVITMGQVKSDPQRATKRPAAVETGRSVMVHEDMAEAVIGEEGAAEFPNIRGRFQPALRLRIEISQFLQITVLLFGQWLDAHGSSHIDHVASRMQPFLFPFLLAFPVIAGLSAAWRGFR